MKKALYVLLAALTIIGMVSCGGGGGGDDRDQITVTFNYNDVGRIGDAVTTKDVVVKIGDKVPAQTDTSWALWDFDGWYIAWDATNPYDFDTPIAEGTSDLTLYAKWNEKTTGVSYFDVSFKNGTTTVSAWRGAILEGDTTGVSVPNPGDVSIDTSTEEYEFIGWYEEVGFLTPWNFATKKVTAATSIYGKWERVWTVTFDTQGGSAIAAVKVVNGGKVSATLTPPTQEAFTFGGWFKDADCSDGEGFVLATDTITASITLYAKWSVIELFDGSERVTLSNATQVIYYFELPPTKTWADYAKITASYLIHDSATWDRSNSGRAIRLYGNYDVDYFRVNTTTAGNKYAYASLDGAANNNQYILAGEGGGWMSLSDALGALLGDVPETDDWFDIDYTIDGSKANAKPHRHLPAGTATGPFIFGLGLPGQDDLNAFYIKDVTLVGTNTADNVVGKPLYITDGGYDYPAFSSYGTPVNNGVDNLSRKQIGTVAVEKKTFVTPPIKTITFDLNDSNAEFADDDTGTIEVSKADSYLLRAPLPTATTTTTNMSFLGWGTTATATKKVVFFPLKLYAIMEVNNGCNTNSRYPHF
jgi:uncharacterized repeat protein (TIGR02543 family)